MSLLTLNGASLPDPTALTVEIADALSSVRRTLSGTACVTRAGIKRRVRIRWAAMTPQNLTALLTILCGDAVVTLGYPDPVTGEGREMRAYCEKRSVGLYRGGKDPVWTAVEITLQEA